MAKQIDKYGKQFLNKPSVLAVAFDRENLHCNTYKYIRSCGKYFDPLQNTECAYIAMFKIVRTYVQYSHIQIINDSLQNLHKPM